MPAGESRTKKKQDHENVFKDIQAWGVVYSPDMWEGPLLRYLVNIKGPNSIYIVDMPVINIYKNTWIKWSELIETSSLTLGLH